MNEQPGPVAPDFLDRLVGKARGEDNGLRPRLPSFFEPTRQVRIDAAVEAEAAVVVDERAPDLRRSVRDTTVEPRALTGDADLRAPARAHAQRQRGPAPSPETVAETSPGVPLTPAREARARRATESSEAPEGGDDLAPTRPRLRVSSAPLAAAVGDSGRMRDGALTPRATGEASSSQTATPDVSAYEAPRRAIVDRSANDARPAGRVSHEVGVLVPSVGPAVRAVVAEAQATRRPSVSESVRVERGVADEAPVVNVTIGRVEVRAVPAPTAPPPRRAPGPRPMSLAEYLEQRGSSR